MLTNFSWKLALGGRVVVHVLTGQNGRPAWAAQGCGDVCISKMCSAGRHAVQMRRFEKIGASSMKLMKS